MVRNPTATTTCVKHLIHNRNALERQLGTLNFENDNIHTLIITLIAIDSMFLLLY